jgi:hypothetical protein
MKQARIFICYASEDRDAVLRMASLIKAHGSSIWIDLYELRPGDILEERLSAGIREADCLAVMLSRRSVQSDWVHKEIEWGLERERQDGRGGS